jgi:hypothetical protein
MSILPDGPGWSPDGGKFWVKGGFVYWFDGEVTINNGFLRCMPGGYEHDNNYSAWTPEYREMIKEFFIKRRLRRDVERFVQKYKRSTC